MRLNFHRHDLDFTIVCASSTLSMHVRESYQQIIIATCDRRLSLSVSDTYLMEK
ncbi:unnamed protein product [Periconia digitata]|uniref:Uncharacterized protein n=1 Tax=Periconia digitata TaxID=1303443 RepID=A0A9W4XWH8_9PLEO|nr:unnamed protein product [Periconia digitata]